MGYGWWWCSLGAVMSMLVWKGVDATVCIIATRNYSRKGRNWKMFCRALVMFDYNVLRDVTAALFCVKHWKSCTLWEWINYWRHTHTQLPATWCDYNDRDDVSEFENVFPLSLIRKKILKVFACVVLKVGLFFSVRRMNELLLFIKSLKPSTTSVRRLWH